MDTTDFWRDTGRLLNEKAALIPTATRFGQDILAEIAESLGSHFGYSVLWASRIDKQRTRIFEKARSLKGANPALSADQLVNQINDFAGGRILVVGLEDVYRAHERLCANKALWDFEIVGDMEDCIDIPKGDGFRGVTQILTIQLPIQAGINYLYELQIMTYLQYSWDQLHHRVYEQIRSGTLISQEIRDMFRNLSADLYEKDLQFDDARKMWLFS